MRRSLFAAFRSADGHSLARALAVVLLLAGLFSAHASGAAAAAPTVGGIHCLQPAGSDGKPVPFGTVDHAGLACCPGMAAPAILPPAPAAPTLRLTLTAPAPTRQAVALDLDLRRLILASPDTPRGPPAA